MQNWNLNLNAWEQNERIQRNEYTVTKPLTKRITRWTVKWFKDEPILQIWFFAQPWYTWRPGRCIMIYFEINLILCLLWISVMWNFTLLFCVYVLLMICRYDCVQVQLVLTVLLGLQHTHICCPRPHALPLHSTWVPGQGPCAITPPAVELATLSTATPLPSPQTPTVDWPAPQQMPFQLLGALRIWAGPKVKRSRAHRVACQSRSTACQAQPPSCST